MADLPDQDTFDGLHSRKPRPRRLSYASQNSTQSFKRHQLRTQISTTSIRSRAESVVHVRPISSVLVANEYLVYGHSSDAGQSEIHSPTPRRHLLLQTESQQWLRAPPLSPVSRPVSSLAVSYSGASSQPQAFKPPRREKTLSFSSLQAQGARQHLVGLAGALRQERESDQEDTGGAGKRWIRWMHKHRMRQWVVPCAILASAWVKWCIGLGSYSGTRISSLESGEALSTRHLPLRRGTDSTNVWRLRSTTPLDGTYYTPSYA